MRRFALRVAIAILFAACASSGPDTTPADLTAARLREAATAFGFGLSPPSYEGSDLPDFLDLVEGNTDILMHAGDWLELEQPSSPFHVMAALAEQRNLAVMAIVSPNSAGNLLRPIDASTRSRYLAALRSFVAETRPEYLGLANEVNMLATDDPSGFADVVSLWHDALEIVREESPDTRAFVTFRYEWLLGRQDGWFGRGRADPSWNLLDQFSEADAIGFTTYPSLVFDDPSDLPDDYYTQIGDNTDLPIYFTEIGWTADPNITILPGSESEQIEYIDLLAQDVRDKLGAQVMVWSFVHADLVTDIPFAGMGLRRPDGQARPAWSSWLALGEK